jgi:exosortase/archaeosortase family protein
MPGELSTLFWLWRIDLLSLPLFVGGTISVVFGCRTLWRLRVPIAFLLLAWPLPYTLFINSWLLGFTNTTLAALRWIVTVVPVARVAPGADGSLFVIAHGGRPFVVSVVSACSGVNGMAGFLIIGTAFAAVVRGRWLPKLAWLAGGLLLTWTFNVLRIGAIFTMGRLLGEGVAVGGLHPVIGLVSFSASVVVMIATMPRFGLRFVASPTAAAAISSDRAPDTANGSRWLAAARRSRGAFAVMTVVTVAFGLVNSELARFELVAGDLGAPRLASFGSKPAQVPGWTERYANSYTFARRFFGDSSTWIRYSYAPRRLGANGATELSTSTPVTADVITTRDLWAFNTYGLEACYQFHGYKIRNLAKVDLGGGITGTTISYYNPEIRSDWTTVYWVWPVKTARGTEYDRVVLAVLDSTKAQLRSPVAGPSVARSLELGLDNSLGGSTLARGVDVQLSRVRQFLLAFSRSIVQSQPVAP